MVVDGNTSQCPDNRQAKKVLACECCKRYPDDQYCPEGKYGEKERKELCQSRQKRSPMTGMGGVVAQQHRRHIWT